MGEILKGVKCSDCRDQLRKEKVDLPTIRPSGFPATTYIGVCVKCQRAHSITGIPIGSQGELYYYKEGRMVCKYKKEEIKKMTNWECVDCKSLVLIKPETFIPDLISEIKISSRVSVCTKCRRVHDENGGKFTVDGKAVYRISGRFVFKEN